MSERAIAQGYSPVPPEGFIRFDGTAQKDTNLYDLSGVKVPGTQITLGTRFPTLSITRDTTSITSAALITQAGHEYNLFSTDGGYKFRGLVLETIDNLQSQIWYGSLRSPRPGSTIMEQYPQGYENLVAELGQQAPDIRFLGQEGNLKAYSLGIDIGPNNLRLGVTETIDGQERLKALYSISILDEQPQISNAKQFEYDQNMLIRTVQANAKGIIEINYGNLINFSNADGRTTRVPQNISLKTLKPNAQIESETLNITQTFIDDIGVKTDGTIQAFLKLQNGQLHRVYNSGTFILLDEVITANSNEQIKEAAQRILDNNGQVVVDGKYTQDAALLAQAKAALPA